MNSVKTLSAADISAYIKPIAEELGIGTGLEIVLRRTAAMILSAPTPELPNSGNGLAAIADLERVLPPLMTLPKDRNANRISSHLGFLVFKGALIADPDGEFVYLPTTMPVAAA